jgi:hypothetical protein
MSTMTETYIVVCIIAAIVIAGAAVWIGKNL